MTPTLTIEIPAAREPLGRRLLALHDELQALTHSAPDGTVLDACEAAVPKGRDLTRDLLADAVARRIAAAEKRGPRSALVRAARPRSTACRRPGNS